MVPTDKAKNYSQGFYNELQGESYVSAKAVLPFVFQAFDIHSVVDFGCGTGSWLRVSRELGAGKTTGVDGPWMRRELLVDPKIELVTRELEGNLNLAQTFDLAISVEVAEHLSAARADGFVRDICAASSRVVFGAAIPGQGGTGHINEQWQSYWANKFYENGFLPIDLIRPQLGQRSEVNTWYRNNILLYVRTAEYPELMQKLLLDRKLSLINLDFVIPEVFEKPGLKHSLRIAGQIPGKVLAAIRRRVKIRLT